MEALRSCRISGYGWSLPTNKISFGQNTRYRVRGDETQMSMALSVCNDAIYSAQLRRDEIDCIVFASSIGFQTIPCSAALVHEQLQLNSNAPALDINTTCTSFISAIDIMSYLVDAGRYKNILIVSSEVASCAINPEHKESFELFSDGAAAIVLSTANEKGQGVISSMQRTWSEGAHWTEIRGGLSMLPPKHYSDETAQEYLFDMNGPRVFRFSMENMPIMYQEFIEKAGIDQKDINVVIPHQASRALNFMMSKIGIKEQQYINWVKDYGNMVSASVPFILSKLIDDNEIKTGHKVILCGTAAGLTANILAMQI